MEYLLTVDEKGLRISFVNVKNVELLDKIFSMKYKEANFNIRN